MDRLPLPLLESLGLFVALALILYWAQRRSPVMRQLSRPATVCALALSLAFYAWRSGGLGSFGGKAWVASAVLFALAAAHFLVVYLFEAHLRSRRGLRLPPLIPKVVVGTVYVIGVFVALSQTTELDLGPLLATSAVTSLVLGLALQPILGNFFSGLVISVERPFRINDWIQWGNVEGRVVDITWRTTHLRTRDSDNLIVPNSEIASRELLNFYYPHPLHLARLYVGVHYRTPPHRVTEGLLEAARAVPAVLEKPSPEVYVVDFADSAINYELRIWIQDIAEKPRVLSDLRRRIWESFRRHDLTIPFPIRTIEIEPRANLLRNAAAVAPPPPPATTAWLFVEEGVDRGLSIRVGDDGVTVGRSAECQLALNDPRTSKTHLRIERADGAWHLVDLGSSAGTQVSGRAVTRHVLKPYERIRLGDTVLVFEIDGN